MQTWGRGDTVVSGINSLELKNLLKQQHPLFPGSFRRPKGDVVALTGKAGRTGGLLGVVFLQNLKQFF